MVGSSFKGTPSLTKAPCKPKGVGLDAFGPRPLGQLALHLESSFKDFHKGCHVRIAVDLRLRVRGSEDYSGL